jgi:hypothetical protein
MNQYFGKMSLVAVLTGVGAATSCLALALGELVSPVHPIQQTGAVALRVVALYCALLGPAVAPLRAPVEAVPGGASSAGLTEPPAAAAFVAAFARRDEAAVEEVASPLYRAEWARRGVSLADRQALLPAISPDNPSGEWIHFSYVGGTSDGRGFGRLLYTGQATATVSSPAVSVWRLDTEPSGRVIWAEMVFLFTPGTTTAIQVTGSSPGQRVALPPTSAGVQPVLVAGVRARETTEAYYAAAMPPTTSAPATKAAGNAVIFVAIDGDGQQRPGAWSYGVTHPGPSQYGQAPSAPVVSLNPAAAALQQSYLDSL